VTIGLPSSASLVLTAPLLREAEVRYPGVQLKVIEHHSGYLIEWLQSGQVDLAIIFDVRELPGLDVQPLLREELYFASPPGRFPPGQAEIPFAQIADRPLILTGPAHGLRMLVERYARAAGGPLHIKTELDALQAIKDLVAAGFGFTVLPWPAIRREVVAGTLHAMKVVEPSVARTVQLATSSDRPPMRSTGHIAALVRELLGALVAQDHWRGLLLPLPDAAA
jgi:LysR family nitrogen assimilation transcriptional regulator